MKEFPPYIKDWKEVRLTESEKARMLKRIFTTPVPSPYTRYLHTLVYVKKPVLGALVLLLVFSTSIAYASMNALPGDKLYAVKTKMVEPVVNVLTFTPVEKLDFQAEKVERRIKEAEALAKKNRLDEEKTHVIEKKIEEDSATFRAAAEKISKKNATTTEKQHEREEDLKNNFRERLERRGNAAEVEKKDQEKINRLKDRAVEVLERRDKKAGSNF